MKILYRISDGGNNKQKPLYVNNKQQMFIHFINIFKNYDIYVFADNVCDETYKFLIDNYEPTKIFRISLGNTRSFILTLDFAVNNFNDDERVYFAEDDYIYKNNAGNIINEGLDLADYSSGYDHPDKYINHRDGGPNPFIENGGELTRVLMSKNSHWKFTNSCCMTFATTVKIIKQDYHILAEGPNDFCIFCNLIQNKNRKLVSSIPAVSTHGETEWLSRLIDWDKEFFNSL